MLLNDTSLIRFSTSQLCSLKASSFLLVYVIHSPPLDNRQNGSLFLKVLHLCLFCFLVTISHFNSTHVGRLGGVQICDDVYMCIVLGKEYLPTTRAAQHEEWSWRFLPPAPQPQLMWIKCGRFTWSSSSCFTRGPQIGRTALHFCSTPGGIKGHKSVFICGSGDCFACAFGYMQPDRAANSYCFPIGQRLITRQQAIPQGMQWLHAATTESLGLCLACQSEMVNTNKCNDEWCSSLALSRLKARAALFPQMNSNTSLSLALAFHSGNTVSSHLRFPIMINFRELIFVVLGLKKFRTRLSAVVAYRYYRQIKASDYCQIISVCMKSIIKAWLFKNVSLFLIAMSKWIA